MNLPPLEDDLHRLADQVTAPASAEARHAIGRRARVLRRRRRIRTAVGTGVLVVLVVAGGLVVRGRDRAAVEMGPARPALAGLPALTVDLDGWQIVRVEETVDAPHPDSVDPIQQGSLQVFRGRGDLARPGVFLVHQPVTDAVVPEGAADPVAIGDAQGYLRQVGPNTITLRWNPRHGDTAAYLLAWGLSRDEVLRFAQGLEPKGDGTRHPPAPDEQHGFIATSLPQGIEEDLVEPADTDGSGLRRVILERASGGSIEVTIDGRGEKAIELYAGQLMGSGGKVEEMAVLDRVALLVDLAGDDQRYLGWLHSDSVIVVVSLTGVERSSVDEVADGVREMSEEEWQALLAAGRAADEYGANG